MARPGHPPLRDEKIPEIPRKSIAAYRAPPVSSLSIELNPRTHGPDTAGARQQEEVTAVNINIAISSQSNGFGMPVSGRARVTSLRVVLATGTAIPFSGQKCALMEQAPVIDGYRVDADAAVTTTGAFPGPSAWSPPI
jgi:hypothetical protein